ncbi:MAG: winged helix-turn-helix domain-containing protein [Nitrospirota bacterium]
MKHISSSSRKRDRQALEKRRISAIKLYKKGRSQYWIAKHLKVSFEAVSNWVEFYKKRGVNGLKTLGKPGPKPRLNDSEKKKIKQAILKGPKSQGFATDLWTLDRIASLIKKLAKVSYHPGHVWKILMELGFTCQKPQIKTQERDEEKIKRWKQQVWPRLKRGLRNATMI